MPQVETIKIECFLNAKRLIEYYILNRLMMAGYKIKQHLATNEETIQSILKNETAPKWYVHNKS